MDKSTKPSSLWMKEALSEAQKTELDVPVGCLVIKDGKLIASGHNRRECDHDPTGHAEIIAIRNAAKFLSTWRLNGCELYTTLEPCPMCAEAIIQARIAKVYFGAYDPKSGACGSAFNLFKKGRIYPIPEVLGGIEEEACKNILSEYFDQQVRSNRP